MQNSLAKPQLKKAFIHLRVQSTYSMLASTLKIPTLVNLATKHKMPAVAMTDRNNLFGALEFAIEACKKGIQPIHGAILTLAYHQVNDTILFGEILILAKNQVGYQNLLILASLPYTKNSRRYRDHISWDDLRQHGEGLIILSGYAEGPIGLELLQSRIEIAKDCIQKFRTIFSDRFYFEVMRNQKPQEQQIEQIYLSLASEYNIPLVATNKVLFEDIKMHDAHDVLLCIAAGVVKDNTDRIMISNQCYFKSQEEMYKLFEDIPSAIKNTVHIAQRCAVKAEINQPMLPHYSYEDYTEEELLRKLSNEGLERRLKHKFDQENTLEIDQDKIRAKYFERLDYELGVVCQMQFAGYFLIVSDFIRWSKKQNIYVGPGRGSGAGSIIAWSLLITDLDPIRFALLFERFLNPERISMPDFDIDFCQERREEVINYVRQKYGDERVGQIITFGKLQAKAVIKDVSRVLGLRYEYADYLTELVPFNAVNPVTLEQAINEVAELRQAYDGNGLYNLTENRGLIKQVLETALVLEGVHRHTSVHAAGIVISGKKLLEVVPVYRDTSGSEMAIIQYSMKYAELAGLVKFDFLGLQTLTIISKCIQLLAARGIELQLDQVRFDDQPTYQMLSSGQSVGVFQFESVGMRDTLRKLKPDCIEDLIALGALYRPGPMDNIPIYIGCKHKRQQADYLHPILKPILEETYGVIVYQEQVLEIAKRMAGYTLGAADILRRAMGKKIKSEMDAQEQLFVAGAIKNNIPEVQAKNIFTSVAKFAGYGFPRAHAAAYAVISYHTAYLKANHPIEFIVACLNLDIRDQEQINIFIYEAREKEINIVPPNINLSTGLFSIANYDGQKSIIFGLGAIKNVTVSFGDEVLNERNSRGAFKSIVDFIERMPSKLITKRALESSIKAGCFDLLHSNRHQLLASIPKLLSHSTHFHKEQVIQQSNFFSSLTSAELFNQVEEFDDKTKAELEFEVLGFFATLHPLEQTIDLCNKHNVVSIKTIKSSLPFGTSKIKFAGVIQRKDSRMSAKGRFITIQFSDPTGIVEATIFSEEILKNYAHLLNLKSIVVVQCDVFKDEGGMRLTATRFFALQEMIQQSFDLLKLKVNTDAELDELIKLIEERTDPNESPVEVELYMSIRDGLTAHLTFKSRHKFLSSDLQMLNNYTI